MISSLTPGELSDMILFAVILLNIFFNRENSRTALVGGGGKTSIMIRCADEAKSRRHPLLLTTTTKLQREKNGPGAIPAELALSPHYQDLPKLPSGPLLWVGGTNRTGDKWVSPPDAELSAFMEENPAQFCLIEADGSAGRPLKAPGDGEPVIPGRTNTVAAVLGLSAIGSRVGRQTVHRLEPFLRICGCCEGDVITPELLVRLILHPEGSFKGVLPGMRRILILNQADTGEDLHHAEKIIGLIKDSIDNSKGIRAAKRIPEIVIVSSFRKTNPIRSVVNI